MPIGDVVSLETKMCFVYVRSIGQMSLLFSQFALPAEENVNTVNLWMVWY